MNDWQLKKIGEISKTTAGGTPSTGVPEYWNNGTIPWMSSGEIHFKRIKNVEKKISELGFNNSNAKLLPPKTILIALAGQGKTRGTVAISEIELTTNQSVAGILVRNESVLPDYVFHNLNNRYEELRNISTGGGREGLNLEIINGIEILLPPLPEQSKIAEILSTVDQVIELTEKEISRLEDLKKGMMNDLFTNGIGHTKFKDSPIGKIPESWEVKPVSELLAKTQHPMRSGPFGSALLKEELVPNGIPLLGIDNIHRERFQEDYKRFITPEKYQELKRYTVFPDDVVITIMGTVGRCCVIPDHIGAAISSKHLWTITFDKRKYLSMLACLQFNNAHHVLNHFRKEQQGGIMEAISSSSLKTTLLPVPSIGEQTRIAESLVSVSSKIQLGSSKLKSLGNIKKALMNDLLTGKVRVKV